MNNNKKYGYLEEQEPTERPADLEDKIISHGGRILNIVLAAIGAVMLFLVIYGMASGKI